MHLPAREENMTLASSLTTPRDMCPKCGLYPLEWRSDRNRFRATCKICRRGRTPSAQGWRSGRRNQKMPPAGTVCQRCGFIAEDICQLDVDHIDGDRTNNAPENLQILCANCHRLKTRRSYWGQECEPFRRAEV